MKPSTINKPATGMWMWFIFSVLYLAAVIGLLVRHYLTDGQTSTAWCLLAVGLFNALNFAKQCRKVRTERLDEEQG